LQVERNNTTNQSKTGQVDRVIMVGRLPATRIVSDKMDYITNNRPSVKSLLRELQ